MLELRYKVLKGLSEGKYPAQIASNLGKNKQTIAYHIKELERDGLIKCSVKSYPMFYDFTARGQREVQSPKSPKSKEKSKNRCMGGKRNNVNNSNNLLEALYLGGWSSDDLFHNLKYETKVDGLYSFIEKMRYLLSDWRYVSSNHKFETVLSLPDCRVQIFVTTDNTLEVHIGCSKNPLSISDKGFMEIAGILGAVRGHIYGLNQSLLIDGVDDWILKGFHRNKDKLVTGSVSGQGINVTFSEMQETFRVYLKRGEGSDVDKVRFEKIESFGKSFGEFRESELNTPAKILEVVFRIQEDVKQFSGIREDINILTKAQGKMANVLSLMAGGNDSKISLVDDFSRDEQDKRFYG